MDFAVAGFLVYMKLVLILAIGIIIYTFSGCCKKFENISNNREAFQETPMIDHDLIICGVGPSAAFTGGHEAWQAFLEKELNRDTLFDKNAPAGKHTVIIQFSINIDGRVFNVKPLTGIGYGIEEKVITAIQKSPCWQPEMLNGKPVISNRRQPVTFIVENEPEL